MHKAILLTSPDLWLHSHGPSHPLKPERLRRTYELLGECGLLDATNVQVVEPRYATENELALFHTHDYISAVNALSLGDTNVPASMHNFGPGDNPVFTGMFDSERLKVGSALLGAEMLLQGACKISFSYGGGLHHARPSFASGFCVFNDAAIAIHWLLQEGLRVAYVDIDVHHGDGVQAAFYEEDRVLTISFHQDGRTLFPGTGYIDEVGSGPGTGYCVNMPLAPYTEDEAYLWAFQQIVPPLLTRFQPDILVTQLGVDTHYMDPLASLALTTHGHSAIFQSLKAQNYPWLALGGGGYNLDVVPRAWTLAFATMSEQSAPYELPPGYRSRYGGRWLQDQETPKIDEAARATARRVMQANIARLRQIHNID